MKYNFDKKIDRKGSNSVKWDTLSSRFNNEDAIPLWVADMDFEVDKNITDKIKKRLEHGIFGYGTTPDSYYEALQSWMIKNHNYNIEKEWVVFAPGVVPGISYVVGAFADKGDEIIIQSPVYHQFYNIIENNGCKVVDNPLIVKDGKYKMDFDDLENKINDKTKMIILCSPHNPIGRVWERDELIKLGEICLKHNILVVCDEIHSDIVYKGYKHTVFSTIDKKLEDISIICSAPNKTFNIAGFKTANIIVANKDIREKLQKYMEKLFMDSHTLLGTIAQEEAYKNGQVWYEELMDYLEENKNFTIDFIKNRIPKLEVTHPEGTYLLWIDFSNLNMDEEELSRFLINDCGVILNKGSDFGKNYGQFQRLNIATQRDVLREALERIEKKVNSIVIE